MMGFNGNGKKDSKFKTKFTGSRGKKAGLAPGSLIAVEEKKDPVLIRSIVYNSKNFEEKEIKDISKFSVKKRSVTWLNVDGVHNPEIIAEIGKKFNLHPLVQEDIMNTDQRPKLEEYDDHLYLVLKMFTYDEEKKDLSGEQVSIILGKDFVVSFQEKTGDVFESVRNRLRLAKGRIRKRGSDYLAYALADSIVDYYFVILEKIGEVIEELETDLISDPSEDTMQQIHSLKRELLYLRKSVWPLREVLNSLQKEGTSYIKDDTRPYVRDLYDHTIQVIDTTETFRDMVTGMLDIYLSSISNRMNEVMKVLTVMASIFIPLTFIAGVYGMNFQYMPELYWKSGYFLTLGLMATVGLGMVVYFRRKDWI